MNCFYQAFIYHIQARYTGMRVYQYKLYTNGNPRHFLCSKPISFSLKRLKVVKGD